MKIGVIGSQSFDDYERLKRVLSVYPITTIVSGGAKGADTLGANYSEEFLGKKAEIYPAFWDDLTLFPCEVVTRENGTQYNRLAGFNRNEDIVANCQLLIAFWDGKSPGTKNSLKIAEKTKRTTLIVYF